MKKLIVASVIFIMGCASTINIPDEYRRTEKYESIYMMYDSIYKIIVYQHMYNFVRSLYGNTADSRLYPRPPFTLYVSEENGRSHLFAQIYYYGDEWIFLDKAFVSDKAGVTLPILPRGAVGRETGACSEYGCSLHERFSAELSDAEIKIIERLMKSKNEIYIRLDGKYYLDLKLHDSDRSAVLDTISFYRDLTAR